jgi:myo-inositol-1(or 4)-monophosphatase
LAFALSETIMNDTDLQRRFDFASALIEEAGTLAHGYFQRLGSLTITSKGQQDMASEADLETEVLIRDRLREAFPEDGFLGEETGRSDLGEPAGVWVVDPIDGTQPFISGMSAWCVSIAFVAAGRLEMGFVTSPARGETYRGRPGHGATLNGGPIQVGSATALTDGIVGVGYSPRVRPDEFLPMFGRLLHAGGMFYREGSGALTLCAVAAGRLIGYVEPHINAWDCLGALAVIEGAGGQISDFLAGDGLWTGNRVIAGPPSLYPKLEALFDESS